MSKNSNPARLNLTDLPRDPHGCLGGLRKALVASANYCKRYPLKRKILLKTLAYVYKYMDANEKAYQEGKEVAEKALKAAKALAEKETKEAVAAQAALLKLEKKQKA
tara:strand:+ start:240 stop:560 length:321 start_codon:yes stop_codon:yes gene_type:complete